VIIHILLDRYLEHVYRRSVRKLDRSHLRKMEQDLEERSFKQAT